MSGENLLRIGKSHYMLGAVFFFFFNSLAKRYFIPDEKFYTLKQTSDSSTRLQQLPEESYTFRKWQQDDDISSNECTV